MSSRKYWHIRRSGHTRYLGESFEIAADDMPMGRIKVRTESDRQTWTAPHFFSSKVNAKEVAELQADGVSV